MMLSVLLLLLVTVAFATLPRCIVSPDHQRLSRSHPGYSSNATYVLSIQHAMEYCEADHDLSVYLWPVKYHEHISVRSNVTSLLLESLRIYPESPHATFSGGISTHNLTRFMARFIDFVLPDVPGALGDFPFGPGQHPTDELSFKDCTFIVPYNERYYSESEKE